MELIDFVILSLFFLMLLGLLTLIIFVVRAVKTAATRHKVAFGFLMLSFSLALVAVYVYTELGYPHGPSVLDRGPIPASVEDTSQLDIPAWVKVVRTQLILIQVGSVMLAIIGVGTILATRRWKYPKWLSS